MSGDSSDALTVAQLVDRTGWSAATVRRKAKTLGGTMTPDGWRFPSVTLTKRVETLSVKLGSHGGREKEADVGPRAAAVFQMLEDGRSTSEIVRELKESPDFVAKMRTAWLQGYEADRRGLEFRCGCGQPSEPSTARCAKCHARSRVLSDDQIATLSGVQT